MNFQSDPAVQYWSNCPPSPASPTNSVFLDTMHTALVAPIEQPRISTFLPRQFSTTTPPVSPAMISSMSQNLGLVTPVYTSNSSNTCANVNESLFQFPPTPKSPNLDPKTRNRSASSEISADNASAEIIKSGNCEKERVMKVQPRPRLRTRVERSSCSSSESSNSEVQKFTSKAFTKWLHSMVTVTKHLENYKYTLEHTVRLLKNWPENHQKTAKLIVDEIRRRMNTAENSYRDAKAAYLHILLVDKILRDRDMKIEYIKLFEKYKIMAALDEVSKSLTESPDKQSTLLNLKKYWNHLFSKRDIISCKKKDTVTTNKANNGITNSDHSPQLHSASTKAKKEKYITPGKIVKANKLDHDQSSQKNKTRAENYLTDPRLKPLPNHFPKVPDKLISRPVSPLRTNCFPVVNINERNDNIPTVSHNNSVLVSAKIRPNNNPTGFSANSSATVPPNNSSLVSAKIRTQFSANSSATVPPNNSPLVSAKIRTRVSATSPATVPPNNSPLVSAKIRTQFSANSPTTVPPKNSLLHPAKTRTNNPLGVSATSPATVPPNNSLLVSVKTVTNDLLTVSATISPSDSPPNPALHSNTNHSSEGECNKDWKDLNDELDLLEGEENTKIYSKKDSKNRKDKKDRRLSSLDSEISERRKKSENKEKTSVKQNKTNQDIQVNPLPEQPDFLTITNPSPKYYCDENICEDNSSRPSEAEIVIPLQTAPTENIDIAACSSIQSNDPTSIFKRPEMIMEPLPPLPYFCEGTNSPWEEENLSQRFPLQSTKDDCFEISDLVDKIHHCYVYRFKM